MKNAHLTIARRVFVKRDIKLLCSVRRASLIACGMSLLTLTAACTTTEHVSGARPVMRNSTPTTMSEFRIADTALDSGNLEMATTLYEKAVKADPHSVDGLTGLGNTLYAVGDFTRAGVYYEHASQADPRATAPLIGIAPPPSFNGLSGVGSSALQAPTVTRPTDGSSLFNGSTTSMPSSSVSVPQ